jgi:hypothetical protein
MGENPLSSRYPMPMSTRIISVFSSLPLKKLLLLYNSRKQEKKQGFYNIL